MASEVNCAGVVDLAEEWKGIELGSCEYFSGRERSGGIEKVYGRLGHGDQVSYVDPNSILGGYCDGFAAALKEDQHEWEEESKESSIQENSEPEINSSRTSSPDQLESKGQSHENSCYTKYAAATLPVGLSDSSVRSETTNKEFEAYLKDFEALKSTVSSNQFRLTSLEAEIVKVRQQLAEANPGMKEEQPSADEQHNQQPLASTVKKDQDCKSCKTKLAHINMIKKKKNVLINQVEELKIKIKELEEINATLCRRRAEANLMPSSQANLLSYFEAWVKQMQAADNHNSTLNDASFHEKLETPSSDRISFVKVGFHGIDLQKPNLLLVHNMQTEKLSVYKEILYEQSKARSEVVTMDWVREVLDRVAGRSEATISFSLDPDMELSSIPHYPLHQSDVNSTVQDLEKRAKDGKRSAQYCNLRMDTDYLSQTVGQLVQKELKWACRNDDYMKLSKKYLDSFSSSSTKVMVAYDSISSKKELPSCCLLCGDQYVLAFVDEIPGSIPQFSIATPSMLGIGSTNFRRLVDRVITNEYRIIAVGDRASNPEIIVYCLEEQSLSRRITSPEFLCHSTKSLERTSATRQRYGGVLGLFNRTLYFCTSKGVHSVDLTNPESEPEFVQELKLSNGADYFEFIRVVDNYLYGVSRFGEIGKFDLEAGNSITMKALPSSDYYPTAISMSREYLLVAATCKKHSNLDRKSSSSPQYDNFIFVVPLNDLSYYVKHKVTLPQDADWNNHNKMKELDCPIRLIKANCLGYCYGSNCNYIEVLLFTDGFNSGFLQKIDIKDKMKVYPKILTTKEKSNILGKKNHKS